MTDVLVASRNAKKLAELHRVLRAAGVDGLRLLSLDDVPAFDEAPETGATFEENALLKATSAALATGSSSAYSLDTATKRSPARSPVAISACNSSRRASIAARRAIPSSSR